MTALLVDQQSHSTLPSVRAETSRVKSEWWRGERDLVERIVQLRESVFAAVGSECALPVVNWDVPWRSAEVVSTLTHVCIDRLRHTPVSDVQAAQRLSQLVLDLQQVAMDIYLYETAVRSKRLTDCVTGLVRLRGIPNVDALVDSACQELVSRCGFHRAVLSRVETHCWRPLKLYQRAEPDTGAWFNAWINEVVPTDSGSPESESLSRRRPSLVYDTANVPVYRPLIVQSGQSRSYLVAPLMHGDDVIGFLHTDHHPLPRRVDEADREVLWAFTDGFSHIYERAVLMQRLLSQRDSMRDLLFGAVERLDELCEVGVEMARTVDDESECSLDRTKVAPANELTERESAVFELMATGATNQEIAESLVIAEGTVKSHVKHILRKYGAVNRAQAIAWALQRRERTNQPAN